MVFSKASGVEISLSNYFTNVVWYIFTQWSVTRVFSLQETIKRTLKYQNTEMELKKNIIHFCFIFVQFVLCLDFGFYNHRSSKLRFIFKLFTFIQCLAINSIMFIYFVNYYPTWVTFLYSITAVNHVAQVLILMFLNSADTFYRLQSDLLSIDSKLIITYNSYAIEYRTIIITVLIVLCRIILVTFQCMCFLKYCLRPLVIQALYLVPLTAFDMPLIMYYFILRAVHFRLKIMTERLTNGNMNIIKCRRIYKSLVIFTDKIKKPFDKMVST